MSSAIFFMLNVCDFQDVLFVGFQLSLIPKLLYEEEK